MNHGQAFADPELDRWILPDINIIGIMVADSISPSELFRSWFNVSLDQKMHLELNRPASSTTSRLTKVQSIVDPPDYSTAFQAPIS